jgi:hypothetical protein
VQEEQLQDLAEVKARYQVPAELQSCHTAIVDGYIIEGHVPAGDIDRLLAERPQVAGLAVPGMPVGSPGMVIQGMEAEPYDVIAFDKQGAITIFASYPRDGEP